MEGYQTYPLDAETPWAIFTSGEEYGASTIEPYEMGLCFGSATAGAVVIDGHRNEVIDWLDMIRAEVVAYAVAEHENGYHVQEPDRHCPGCLTDSIEAGKVTIEEAYRAKLAQNMADAAKDQSVPNVTDVE